MPPKRKAKRAATPTPTPTPMASTDPEVFSKLKLVELQDECTQRGLDTKGKKSVLVKRLTDYEENNNDGMAGGKKVKKEETDADDEEEEDMESMSMKDKLKKLAEEEKRNKKKTFQVDACYPRCGSGKVVGEFDCMLNQTNIGHNNNKFYIIQVVDEQGNYFVWNRWGRVGETGQSALKNFSDNLEAAEKDFKKKFKDKTKNNWDERDNFTPHSGKYTLIEMDAQDETDNAAIEERLDQLDGTDTTTTSTKSTKQKTKKCELDENTQSLMKLIFNNDMFKEQMAKMNIDVKKMPLGKLSKSQIAKGFEVLEEIEEAIKKSNRKTIEELTSRFYTLIPHAFGRSRPPIIADQDTVRLKFDMLLILGDIEIAQSLQKVQVKKEEDEEEIEHPLDINYNLLKCGLKHIDSSDERFKLISEYTSNTKAYSGIQLLDVWEVAREGADERFSEHKDISHRKLLWHGTNIAVVVAILKTGLRIMPHSGGRVGSGIYFASENGKSSAYVGSSNDGTGIMFLNEVALGNQNVITRDDSSLKKAPAGFDSVHAKGTQEPDPKHDVKIEIDGNDVIVPKGKPIRDSGLTSSFHQSEYLVYKESQCCIRYLLKFHMR